MSAQRQGPNKPNNAVAISEATGMTWPIALAFQAESAPEFLGPNAFRAPADLKPGETQAQRIGLAQKSGMTLTKSSNWGPMRGLISSNEDFTKIELQEGKGLVPVGLSEIDRKKTPHYLESHETDGEKPPALTKVPATESLESILNRVGPDRDYRITGFDPLTKKLSFVCNEGRKPSGVNYEFSVKLPIGLEKDHREDQLEKIKELEEQIKNQEQERNRLRPQEALYFNQERNTLLAKLPQGILELRYQDGLNINDLLKVELVCSAQQYEMDTEGTKNYLGGPTIIEVFADSNGNPYTGDWDQLLIAHACHSPDWMRFPVDTFEAGHQAENMQRLTELSIQTFEWLEQHGHIDPKIIDKMKTQRIPPEGDPYRVGASFEDLISDFLKARAGGITPFEFTRNTLLNYQNYGLGPDSEKSLQHGCENRNPYKPSNLDGNMVHFIDGKIRTTKTEQEIVNLYLETPNYLNNNNIDLHPLWDMSKWGPIVEAQLTIAEGKMQKGSVDSVYLPPSAVLENYNKFLLNPKPQAADQSVSPAAPILERVSKILLDPDFFKHNQFYDVTPGLFTGPDAEENFCRAVDLQEQAINSRKEQNDQTPTHTIKAECLAHREAIRARQKAESIVDAEKVEGLTATAATKLSATLVSRAQQLAQEIIDSKPAADSYVSPNGPLITPALSATRIKIKAEEQKIQAEKNAEVEQKIQAEQKMNADKRPLQ